MATLTTNSAQGAYAGQPILMAGAPLDQADAAMIMVHGRGASARDILGLASELNVPGYTFIAPQAAGNTWYPFPFREPLSKNEPNLSSALSVLDTLVAQLGEAGFSREKIVLLCFSQGACLASTYVAQHARRYRGFTVLRRRLIRPPDKPPGHSRS